MPHFLYKEGTSEPMDLPVFNTFVSGISGHGKTEFIKSYIGGLTQENPHLKILVIDSTDDQEYGEIGHAIPICFVDTTDSFVLKDLLSAITHIYMDRYIGEIIDELAIAESLRSGCEAMEKKLKAAKKAGRDRRDEDWLHPRERKNILVVATALRKLLDLAEKMNVVDHLELQEGINRMNLSLKGVDPNLKLGFQQLIVRSVALQIVNNWRGVFTVLDEGQKWIPQRYGSVAKQAVSDLLGEGRKLADFSLIASQTMVKTDKEPLYNVRYYVMGLHTHPNEVKRSLDVLSDVLEGTELKAREIKSLDDGWFWVLTKKQVTRAYARPSFMRNDLAVKVAKGQLTSKEAWDIAKKEQRQHPSKAREVALGKKQTPHNRLEQSNSRLAIERSTFDVEHKTLDIPIEPPTTFKPDDEKSVPVPTQENIDRALEVATPASSKVEAPTQPPLGIPVSDVTVKAPVSSVTITLPDLEPKTLFGRVCVVLKEGTDQAGNKLWTENGIEAALERRGWNNDDVGGVLPWLIQAAVLTKVQKGMVLSYHCNPRRIELVLKPVTLEAP